MYEVRQRDNTGDRTGPEIEPPDASRGSDQAKLVVRWQETRRLTFNLGLKMILLAAKTSFQEREQCTKSKETLQSGARLARPNDQVRSCHKKSGDEFSGNGQNAPQEERMPGIAACPVKSGLLI